MTRLGGWYAAAIALAFFLLPARGLAQSYTFDWLTSGGGVEFDRIADIVVAPDGTIAATGAIEGPTSFGSITLPGDGTPSSSADGLVMKLARDGTVVWANQISGPESGYDEGRSVAVDSSGDIWVAGNFDGTVVFDPATSLTSVGPADAFIAKYSPDGTLLFARQFGNDAIFTEGANSIGVDATGNAYFVIQFSRPLTIGGTTVTPMDIFSSVAVVKLAPDGAPLWTVHFNSETTRSRDIDVDAAGNVAITGSFRGTLNAGTSSLAGAGRDDVFVAKLAADGTVTWLVGTGSGWYERGWEVAHASGGDVIVAGSADRDVTLFGFPVRPALGRGLFMARFDSAGRARWLVPADSTNPLWLADIAVESDGDIVFVGWFLGDFRAGPTMLTGPATRHSSFIIRLDGSGGILGVDRVSSAPDGTWIEAVASPAPDRILIGGRFRGTLALDGNRITSRGDEDAWIAGGFPRIIPPEEDPYGDGVHPIGPLGSHIHWRCTPLVRRVLGDPNLRCPGVFKHGAAPQGAEDIFSATLTNATLASGTEVDEFSFSLPNITNSRLGDDHADIRPDTPPFRSSEPEPLRGCHAVQRLAPGPVGAPSRNEIWVTTAGQLTVRIDPMANDFAERPVSLTNERVRIYDGRRLLDDITVSSRGQAVITCPIDIHELANLRVTFGERDPGEGPRSIAAQGGYTLEIEYRIDARRGIPEWASDRFFLGEMRAFAPAGCEPGRFGGFPNCVPGFVPRFETPHPRLPRPDCLADGPGCWELTWFEWAADLERFELTLDLAQGMEIQLLSAEGQMITSATSALSPNAPERREFVELAADLEPGLYFLAINGPPTKIGMTVGLSEQPPSLPRPPLRFQSFGLLTIVIVGLVMALLGMLFVSLMNQRR